MKQETRDRLAEIFRVVFDLPADADLSAVQQGTTAAWDSLGHVSLVTALASEFDVEITAMDSLDIISFDTAADVLEDLLNE